MARPVSPQLLRHGVLPVPDDAPAHYLVARGELGVKEVRGKEYHPRILEYFSATSLGTAGALRMGGDETAWCSAFGCWCVERAGGVSPHSAAARSWLRYGAPVDLSQACLGDMVVLWRGDPDGAYGHFGFYSGRGLTGGIWLLGGNQHNCVSYAHYPLRRLLGVRRAS